MKKPRCLACGDIYSAKRAAVGYSHCMPCGDKNARATVRTVAPLNKSNYIMVTDMAMLKQLNPKRTEV